MVSVSNSWLDYEQIKGSFLKGAPNFHLSQVNHWPSSDLLRNIRYKSHTRSYRGCTVEVKHVSSKCFQQVIASLFFQKWHSGLIKLHYYFQDISSPPAFKGLFNLHKHVNVPGRNWLTALYSDMEEFIMHPRARNVFPPTRKQKEEDKIPENKRQKRSRL